MNNRTLHILALSICLYTGRIYGMDIDNELKQIALKEDRQELLQTLIKETTINITHIDNDESVIACTQPTKEQILQSQISKRKLFNVLYGITTVAMMGVDIANSYWDEKGLLTQNTEAKRGSKDCRCPNNASWCEIKDTGYWTPTICSQTLGSNILYIVNDSTTICRVYAGLANLHCLYLVQQALNEHTADKTTALLSCKWCWGQSINSGAMGIIAGIAGVVNGIKNYPRTITIWGLNAAVDAVGSFNWYENVSACDEIIKQTSSVIEIKNDTISIGSDSSDSF